MQPPDTERSRDSVRRVRVGVSGIVQGVGFRPFVYRLARTLGLDGFVLNDPDGVTIEVEGPGSAIDRLVSRLREDLPPLATVDRLDVEEMPRKDAAGFTIRSSARSGPATAPVTPDAATCDECLAEVFDPADRRFRYPFTNCTNCGPRYTIVRGIPYDRPRTTMAGFDMCAECRAEYSDPADRRFHAQPNACPACGPTLELVAAEGTFFAAEGTSFAAEGTSFAAEDAPAAGLEPPGGDADPIRRAARALDGGRIVAVKGLGGYHLACDAASEEAVRRLRGRKRREDRPFALMAADIEAARELVDAGHFEAAWLTSVERPIVLARRRHAAAVADSVAPGHRDLGVMLPYTPLHHLLLADLGRPLVMTSGNLSDEPIAYRDEDALQRLSGIADLFLTHDRPIQARTDDSVLRVVRIGDRDRTLMLRRSRGFVPVAIELPAPTGRDVLGTGAHLKNTFCLARGRDARVSHHIGDLDEYETLLAYREGIDRLERLLEIAPEIVAHDLHPDYPSTRVAEERETGGLEAIGVQHHHAHFAACLGELGETGAAVGAVFDGTGLGTDGTVWGGELFVGDAGGARRAGHLHPVRLPGGEAAIREPWRMACAWLHEASGGAPAPTPALAGRVDPERWAAVASLCTSEVSAPVTTSVGRLFDAVAALCGLRTHVTYEGQAAIELEMAAARSADGGVYPLAIDARPTDESGETVDVLDARETIRAVTADVDAGTAVEDIAARFHRGLADATARALTALAEREGLTGAVLSGGVFQNRILLEETATRLCEAGLRVLVPERLPPNDGGISYGQVVAAIGRSPEGREVRAHRINEGAS